MQATEHRSAAPSHILKRVVPPDASSCLRALPAPSLTGDTTRAFLRLARSLRHVSCVMFPAVPLGDLDAMFRLRLIQILCGWPRFDAVSVIELTDTAGASRLAGGFPARFRSAWPFARCLFIAAKGQDATSLSTRLGQPVFDPEAAGDAGVSGLPPLPAPRIALQIQPAWYRCGSTTVFENQVESLVQEGFFTLRVFHDSRVRRGPTLDSWSDTLCADNQVHAGAHANVIAVPQGPPRLLSQEDDEWPDYLDEAAASHIGDRLLRAAAARAEVAVTNHVDLVGAALRLSPKARLLLATHDDRAAATRAWAEAQNMPPARIESIVDAAASVQARILRIPDLAMHVSATEHQRLGPISDRSAVVLPRIYPAPPAAAVEQRFDLLILGDAHRFNVLSVRWFLKQVWVPFLSGQGLQLAIVGRVGQQIDPSPYIASGVHVLGFVDDLETFRAACRLTVIPDQLGTGVAVKLLTTLANGHPLVATPASVRGLDPAIRAILPVHDSPAAMAADIIGLLRDPEKRAERARLAQEAHRLVAQTTDLGDLLASIPMPDDAKRAQRRQRWDALIGARPQRSEPFRFAPDTHFCLSGTPFDADVLLTHWQEPEPWGRWTDGAVAGFRLLLAQPAEDLLRLELDISPSPIRAGLTLVVEGRALARIDPVPGCNAWDLPADLTAGKTRLLCELRVDRPFRPCDLPSSEPSPSDDNRILGIGVCGITLRLRQPTLCTIGIPLLPRAGQPLQDVLLTGWHKPEDWGCWTSEPEAEMVLRFGKALRGPLKLELDISASAVPATLTVTVGDHQCAPVPAASGKVGWLLPQRVTGGRTELSLRLSTSLLHRPSDHGSNDNRWLGAGVKSIALLAEDVGPPMPLGTRLAINAASGWGGIHADGWHKLEPWGVWSRQAAATLTVYLADPIATDLLLVMDLGWATPERGVTVSIDRQALPPQPVIDGQNRWLLPPSLVAGKTELTITLQVDALTRPCDRDPASPDDRSLGIALRGISLQPAPAFDPAFAPRRSAE